MLSEEIRKGRPVEAQSVEAADEEGPDWPKVVGYGIASAMCFFGAKMIGRLIRDAGERGNG